MKIIHNLSNTAIETTKNRCLGYLYGNVTTHVRRKHLRVDESLMVTRQHIRTGIRAVSHEGVSCANRTVFMRVGVDVLYTHAESHSLFTAVINRS